LADVVEPWIEGLWPALGNYFEIKEKALKFDVSPKCKEERSGERAVFFDKRKGYPRIPALVSTLQFIDRDDVTDTSKKCPYPFLHPILFSSSF